MPSPRFPIPQGTIERLALHILSPGPAHRRHLAVQKDSSARLSDAVSLIFEEGSR